ncbi:fatty-acid amide hydrolase 2-like [Arctopsyche grandis]|uniref:fatty-acid amide hydrolase 2-like n=1 Tax=Arctopsyche grandis TaxID=121162 RepID=UPI00406D8E52
MSHNSGVYKVSKDIASFDAKVVMQIKSAGAIPILVSNTPEMCLCWETFNYVTGTTKNPYDTTKTSGGSSGGEAALLSSAASVIGIGSDTCGSLRLPAMYNSIFAHKPTSNYVSMEGHKPNLRTKILNNLSCVGPMTRYAEDLPLLLRIMKDPLADNLNLEAKVSIDMIKLYYMEGDGSGMVSEINSDVKTAIEKVIRYFEDVRGIKVKKVSLKHMKHACDMSMVHAMEVRDAESVFEQPFKLSSLTLELAKNLLGCSKSIFTSIAFAYMRKARDCVNDNTFKEYAEVIAELKQEFLVIIT